jgi:hypothetical protein
MSCEQPPLPYIEPLTARYKKHGPVPVRASCTNAHVIALTALVALGLSGVPFHEPIHADGRHGLDRNRA